MGGETKSILTAFPSYPPQLPPNAQAVKKETRQERKQKNNNKKSRPTRPETPLCPPFWCTLSLSQIRPYTRHMHSKSKRPRKGKKENGKSRESLQAGIECENSRKEKRL